jgi:hypothetical protein
VAPVKSPVLLSHQANHGQQPQPRELMFAESAAASRQIRGRSKSADSRPWQVGRFAAATSTPHGQKAASQSPASSRLPALLPSLRPAPALPPSFRPSVPRPPCALLPPSLRPPAREHPAPSNCSLKIRSRPEDVNRAISHSSRPPARALPPAEVSIPPSNRSLKTRSCAEHVTKAISHSSRPTSPP